MASGEASGNSEQTVEVAHEALIRTWPTLRKWLADDRSGQLLRLRLSEDAAMNWLTDAEATNSREQKESPLDYVYRGGKLEVVMEWGSGPPR